MALCAKDVMTTDVVVSREDMSVADFVVLLKKHKISGTPVLDHQGYLVGVASATDVLLHCRMFEDGWQMDSDYHTQVGGEPGVLAENFEDENMLHLTVGDIMSPEAITARADEPIREVAAVMCREEIRRVIIVQDAQLAGIVSMTDILQAIVDERIQ